MLKEASSQDGASFLFLRTFPRYALPNVRKFEESTGFRRPPIPIPVGAGEAEPQVHLDRR
jgi:hypothetical protein